MRKWFEDNWVITIALLFTLGGIFAMIFFAFNNNGFYNEQGFNPQTAAHYGNFITGVAGSIFSLVGVLFLFITLYEQRKNNHIQQFEARLFELIRYHRQNVDTLNMITPYEAKENRKRGRDVFVVMIMQFNDIYNSCSAIFKNFKITDEREIIQITYLLLFFGVSERNRKTLEWHLVQFCKLTADQTSMLILHLIERKTLYNKSIVFYEGHQSKLGQYFRHMYRTINYIRIAELSASQKQEYIKLYRSQLTNYEQAILFLNSQTRFGRSWRELISDYELIRNIPEKLLNDINPKQYYPEIIFETEY